MLCPGRYILVESVAGPFSTLKLRFAYFVPLKVFKGCHRDKQYPIELKIIIMLDFENEFFPTYLKLCSVLFCLLLANKDETFLLPFTGEARSLFAEWIPIKGHGSIPPEENTILPWLERPP